MRFIKNEMHDANMYFLLNKYAHLIHPPE
ncbi:hypothetical protein F01_420186 [Burkholderia cenocepacia]|nr:hypothetical protein F01_420186 [Burkholderia cenocepacia]